MTMKHNAQITGLDKAKAWLDKIYHRSRQKPTKTLRLTKYL